MRVLYYVRVLMKICIPPHEGLDEDLHTSTETTLREGLDKDLHTSTETILREGLYEDL